MGFITTELQVRHNSTFDFIQVYQYIKIEEEEEGGERGGGGEG